MRRIHLAAALVLVLALVGVSPEAFALPPDPIKDALNLGGTHLKNQQNGDGGWFFEVGDADCGLGAGVSCPNTFGVTAMGLLDAFRVTKNLQVKAAAVETGDALVAKRNAAPVCDGNPGIGADRPFTADVRFLAELTLTTGRAVYKNAAKSWFACVTSDFPVAADRANNRINGRIAQGLNNL